MASIGPEDLSTLPTTDPGERIYAIGDLHGRFDLLKDMLDRIGEHSAALPQPQALHIVFLGDLIDRGPDSARILEYLYDLQRRSDRVIVLQGNHEEALVRSMEGDLGIMRMWLGFGGRETLRSFGIDPDAAGADLEALLREMRARIPRQWIGWLKSLPLNAQSGDYYFCHAGIKPGVPLRRQTRSSLLWIRDEFLDHTGYHGAVIVHGHSIEPQVALRPNRIGIDTGAYRTGALTALYLEDDRREILTARAEAPADEDICIARAEDMG